MDYYCDICDEIIKIKNEHKHLQCLSHTELDKCIRIKRTIENPDFFDIHVMLNKYITNHKKNLIYISLNMFLN